MSVLSVEHLSVHYDSSIGTIQAVDDVSFDIPRETIVGLLGESGCGKTTLARSLVRELPENGQIVQGSITLDGENILEMTPARLRDVRWKDVAYIPQSAMGSLDPVYKIREQLLEILAVHRPALSKDDGIDRVKEVMSIVDINHSRLDDYPHQLSGGMRQRVLLAMSLILEPKLIIADEPTTGLDVLIRDKILNDIERYRNEFGISVLFVSHDIADLVETSDSLMVMYGGKIVETGSSSTLLENPVHPYTMGLKKSLPEAHTDASELIAMGMEPPSLINPPEGCRFREKCPFEIGECSEHHPELQSVDHGGRAACFRAGEAASLRARIKEGQWR